MHPPHSSHPSDAASPAAPHNQTSAASKRRVAQTFPRVENAANQKEIESLQSAVKTGNDLIGQQRQDFLKQFGDMSGRLAALQTQIKTADLQTEAAELRTELEANRKAMEPSKAKLSFYFWHGSDNFSRTITLNLDAGAVNIPFTIANDSDADALEGSIIVRICDACKFTTTPPGFSTLSGQDEHERSIDFQHIFASTHTPEMTMSVMAPPGGGDFQVGIMYRCRTCSNVKIENPWPPTLMGTVTLGNYWTPRQFQPKGNLVSPKR